MQVLQHRHWVQSGVYAGTLGKLGPADRSDFHGRIEGVAGCLVQPNETFLEEEVPNLVAGQLLAGGSLPDEEAAPEGVWFAVLFRHCYQQHLSFALHLHGHGRVCRTGNTLHLGLQPIVVRHADHGSGVVNPDQNDTAGGVGEGAELSAEVRGQGPFELGGESFAQRDQVG